MSIGRRLLKLARTELGDVLRRFRHGSDDGHPKWSTRSHDPEAPPPPPRVPNVPDHVVRWYGNLELPVGSSAEEVRTAYRHLMRRYHPDRHARDPGRAAVATALSLELREAYEGLMDYLSVG